MAEIDEINPLAALLAKADTAAPTLLDDRLKKLNAPTQVHSNPSNKINSTRPSQNSTKSKAKDPTPKTSLTKNNNSFNDAFNDPTNTKNNSLNIEYTGKSNETEDIIVVRDKDPSNETTNIGLGFRQPSFSSLTDVVVTKGGEVVEKNCLPDLQEEDDPVIVFDSRSSSTNDNNANTPIGLTVRQPSFVSLGHGQIIPKGSGSLAEFQPILEEAVPNTCSYEDAINEEIDENDKEEVPEIHLIQELKAKNIKRWKEMGYEPPANLIPFVRAASMARMTGVTGSSNINDQISKVPAFSASQNCMQTLANANGIQKPSNFNQFNDVIPEENSSSENTSQNKKNNDDEDQQPAIRRSSSFGMKLGEAKNKSIEMMREIICESPKVTELSLEEIPDDDEEVNYNVSSKKSPNKEKTENAVENEEELPPELYGNLKEIDPEITGPPVYRTLLTGEIDFAEDTDIIRQRLNRIAEICADHLWLEETSYIHNLLTIVNQTRRKGPRLGFNRENPQDAIEKLNDEISKIEDEFDQKLIDAEERKNQALQQLDDEYRRKAEELDHKYQDPATLKKFAKPSKELLRLRDAAKKLLKQNRIAEATKTTQKIRQMEVQEQKMIAETVKERYFADDRRLKEESATFRKIAIQKHQYEVAKIENERKEMIETIEKRITKLEIQIDEEEALQKLRPKTLSFKESRNIPGVEPSEFTEKGVITVRAPKRLMRENDMRILDEMTKEIMDGVEVKQVDIESVFKRTAAAKKDGSRTNAAKSTRRKSAAGVVNRRK